MQEAFNPDRTKLIIYINNGDQKLDVYDRNLGNEDKNLGNEDKNLGFANRFYYVIERLNIKKDIKSNLKNINNVFNDKIFGNIDIIKCMCLSKNTATSYKKYLKELDLIEPVYGYGKGKYKFKK